MIIVTKQKDVLNVDIKIRKPAIHLDHWALRRISSEDNFRFIFLSFFRCKGTLVFSWANVLDIVGQDDGRSLDEIKSFLSEIGEQWALARMSPGPVMRDEENPNFSNSPPWVDIDFLKMYYPIIHGGPLTLSRIIDLVNANREDLKKQREDNQREIKTIIEESRVEFAKSKTILELYKKIIIKTYEERRFCRAVFSGLLRAIFSRQDQFKDNDVTDFFHSVVNLAYSDIVLLDKHWKNLAESMPRLRPSVKVYKEGELIEFFKFLRTQFSYEEKQLVKNAYERLVSPNV